MPAAVPTWQQSWLPSSRAQATATIPGISDPVSAVCQSHAGCEGSGKTLPRCTAPGAIPSGFFHLKGRLEATEHGPQLQGTGDGVLSCTHRARGEEQLVVGAARYNLGLGCTGDRTGWCCPYASGTSVEVVAKREDPADPNIGEYWLCADPAPPPPPSAAVAASAAPALLDLAETPGTVVWATQHGVAIWSVTEPGAVIISQTGAESLSCISIAPDRRSAFSIASSGEATLWGLPEGRKLAQVSEFAAPHRPESIEPDLSCTYLLSRKLEWSPSGDRLLTVQLSSVVRLWEATHGSQHELESRHAAASTHGGYFDADSATLLLPNASGQLELRQTSDGKLIAQTKGSGGRFAPDSSQILVDDDVGSGSELRVWQPKTGTVHALLPEACGVEVSADGRRVAALAPCGAGHQQLIEVSSGRRLAQRDGLAPLFSSSRYRAPRYRDDLALLIEKTLPPSRPREPSATADAPELLALPDTGGVELRAHGHPPMRVAGTVPPWLPGVERFARLAFSPDGKSLASPSWIWSVAAPKRSVQLDAAEPLSQLIFSPDSRFLATWAWTISDASSPSKLRAALRVYDVGSGKLLQRLDVDATASVRQAQLGVSSPAWLPQSSALVLPVVGDAGAIEILNVVTGEHVRVALGAEGELQPAGGLERVRDVLKN